MTPKLYRKETLQHFLCNEKKKKERKKIERGKNATIQQRKFVAERKSPRDILQEDLLHHKKQQQTKKRKEKKKKRKKALSPKIIDSIQGKTTL